MNVERILEKLDKVRPAGKSKWMSCCPAHADTDPSLAISETQDGRVLVHCFAGCGGAEVMSAIGMTLSDLYPDGATGEWFSFGRERKIQKKSDDRLNVEKNVVVIAAIDRLNGKRLSQADMMREQQAFQRLHAGGHL